MHDHNASKLRIGDTFNSIDINYASKLQLSQERFADLFSNIIHANIFGVSSS